jgi:hypothetical protein
METPGEPAGPGDPLEALFSAFTSERRLRTLFASNRSPTTTRIKTAVSKAMTGASTEAPNKYDVIMNADY